MDVSKFAVVVNDMMVQFAAVTHLRVCLMHTSYGVGNSTQANNRLAKRGGHTMAITPRHYLDFINQYANLFNEKRSELEEQQMHLNVGLRKIKETVDQVQ